MLCLVWPLKDQTQDIVVPQPRLPKVLKTSSAGDAVSYSTNARSSTRIDHASSSSLFRGSPLSYSKPRIVRADLHRMSGVLVLHHPLHRSIVRDWDSAEHVWCLVAHDRLSVTPGEHPYLITEAILNPRPNREKLTQFFFESLSAPALHIAYLPAFSLFSFGRTTVVVLDVATTARKSCISRRMTVASRTHISVKKMMVIMVLLMVNHY